MSSASLHDLQTGRRHPLDPAAGRFVFGRARDADVRIANGLVGRLHTFVEPHPAPGGTAWWVRDAGSTNGTELNGVRLGQAGVILRPGDVLGVTDHLFVFEADYAASPTWRPLPPPAPPPAAPPPLDPAEVIREVAAELLARAGLDDAGYRTSGLESGARAAARAACAKLPPERAEPLLGALDALDRLDAADTVGAFSALLSALDRRRPPGPLYVRLAQHLVAFSSWHAAPLLARRAAELLDAGLDAAPCAALLAATWHPHAIAAVRTQAERLRGRGDPRGAAALAALHLEGPPPWVPALHAQLFPVPADEQARRRWAALEAAARAAPRTGPAEPAQIAEALALLQAAPAADVVRRAGLRRLLEDLTGELRGPDPEAWLRPG